MSQSSEQSTTDSKVEVTTALAVGVLGLIGGVYAAKQSYKDVKTPAELGLRVRDARKAMKLTQQEFADLAGVGRRFVSELEAGKQTLEFGKVLRACQAAGLDLFSSQRNTPDPESRP